ncbi:MAG: DNA-binding protein WhiA [Lachnospiraceae bacterium]|nr:DNA-binding protein WhiA [Lachnospiraceae bacterium]
MSFSVRVKQELLPLQKKAFTLPEKNITIDRCGSESDPSEDAVRAAIREAFLAGGSISDPSKSYHLEIATHSRVEAESLVENMSRFDVEGKIHRRKEVYVVYLKDGSDIASMLAIMGAHLALMDFENARILNEMRGSVNRQVNCETANIKRTVNTAVRQIEAIRRIEETIGLESLPPSLQEMARIRLAYPQSSLVKLGAYLHPPVGKSGVNHRLRKIIEIAEGKKEK